MENLFMNQADEIKETEATAEMNTVTEPTVASTQETVTEFEENVLAVETTEPDTVPTAAGLPEGYLSDGYFATTEKGAKYLRPEYVAEYAQKIAAILAGMKPTDFNALLREMKRSKKSTLPFEARQTAAAEMLPKALSLVSRKKAPPVLVDMIRANLDAIKTDEDWTAFYRHLEAISGYLCQLRQ